MSRKKRYLTKNSRSAARNNHDRKKSLHKASLFNDIFRMLVYSYLSNLDDEREKKKCIVF